MDILSGKEEISYLIVKVMQQFEDTSGLKIVRNTNRENYVAIARELSLISNNLPYSAVEKKHQEYEEASDKESGVQYPHRKYDITGGQIKDVFMGLVKKPRPHLVDSCYIYLYGVGRIGFVENPVDRNLMITNEVIISDVNTSPSVPKRHYLTLFLITLGLLIIACAYLIVSRYPTTEHKIWTAYQPTEEEIELVTGIWLYQTGAPQARSNEEKRYRRYATNILTIKKVGSNLLIDRHGATINHTGYVEFTSPGILSIHSYVERTDDGALLNPSHSLAKLDPDDNIMYAISSTWSFESENNNDIIGARNIYAKLGADGELREVVNTPENAACHCKIIEWIHDDGTAERFNLTYDEIEPGSITEGLDESSLILRKPKAGVLLSHP